MNAAKTLLICLVDDDEAVRASTRFLLETAGYRVSDFANAEAFLAVSRGHDASCLVLDLHMKDISGLELLELLRSRGDQTPAIFLTANGTQLQARYSKAGVLAVIPKPPNPRVILDCIKRATSGV